MSTALAQYDLSREKIDLIKQTVAKGSTDLELELFLHACKRTGLDPLMKQIYAIKRWNGKLQREEMSIQTGIDGYRLIADRTGCYAGSDEPKYEESADQPGPYKATVTVYKMVAGQRCAFSASALWDEYCQLTKEGKPMSLWGKMPYLMLAKCAESLALRKAFPAELSGVYTHEEMMQAESEQKAIEGEVIKPSLKPSDIPKRSETVVGDGHEVGNGTAGHQSASTIDDPVSQDALPPVSDGAVFTDYSQRIKLSQSVSECSTLLNEIVKDQRLTVFDVTKLQDEAKAKMAALRKAK